MHSLQENANCLLAHATFRVVGAVLDPNDVTAALQLEPSQALRTGQLVPTATQIRRQELGVWLLKSEGHVVSTSLERHLNYLLDRVEPGVAALRRLQEAQEVSTDFFCFWMSATGHGGPVFSTEVLQRVARIGAELGIDFYGGGAEDDDSDLQPPPRTKLQVVRPPDGTA